MAAPSTRNEVLAQATVQLAKPGAHGERVTYLVVSIRMSCKITLAVLNNDDSSSRVSAVDSSVVERDSGAAHSWSTPPAARRIHRRRCH